MNFFKKKNESGMTRKQLCDGLETANDWHALNQMWLSDKKTCKNFIDEKIHWLSECIDKELWNHRDSKGFNVNKSIISERFMTCYSSAQNYIVNECIFEAFHEIHDCIYIFGLNLKEPVSATELLLLKTLVNLYTEICSSDKDNSIYIDPWYISPPQEGKSWGI